MKKMIKFAVSRYAYFLSYVAAFLAGVAVVVPAIYMLIPLAAAVVLGSASAYYRRIGFVKDIRERMRLECMPNCKGSAAAASHTSAGCSSEA